MTDEIEQEFPFWTTYFRYQVFRNNDRKPIAKFNSQFEAERFIKLVHEQDKTWERKSYYRLVLNGKTQITL